MTEKPKRKPKSKHRTQEEIANDLERRAAEIRRKLADKEQENTRKTLLVAIRNGEVPEENQKEYKKKLAEYKSIMHASSVFSNYGLEAVAAKSSELREKLEKDLRGLLEDNKDNDEDDPDELDDIEDDEENDDEEDDEDEDDEYEEDDDEEDDEDDFDE